MSKITVEVAYALPEKQQIKAFEVEQGTTAEEAAKLSGLDQQFAELDIAASDLGIFGKSVKKGQVLKAGDRVEIYRPLLADPKEVRKQRAAKAKKA